ncbi:hypothetical protein [Micromonospora sp. AKA38]|uniref:hypothetical protein n=1 Tax=Micromonospora sp. AKA38 TaxID=2733861 RepID=UPI0024937C14|nr:hypothetical protein [Micromonospora sp. AKA38]
MAQRNSSGRGTTATRTKRHTGNRTPNTPKVSESEISRMKVDDIRGQLRRRGVSGTSTLRKPELVKTLARTMRAEGRGGAARRSTGPAGRPAAAKKTTAAKKTAARKTAPARRKATSAAKAAPATRAAGARAKATGTRKAAPARAKATAARAGAVPSRAKATPARAGATSSRAKSAPARAQAAPTRGPASSRSIGSSQLITSLADRPERPGRSLVTRNHEVIQRWARARGAKPATIAGTERGDRPGVLTFNLPGYRESSRLREITWDAWFRTFDSRRLNLIYQEQLRDGRQSNFFRTENPNREDG